MPRSPYSIVGALRMNFKVSKLPLLAGSLISSALCLLATVEAETMPELTTTPITNTYVERGGCRLH